VTDTTTDSEPDTAETIDDSGVGAVVVASVASVALALYFYYVRGDKQRGQFIGLWPATILGLASYLKLREIKQALVDAEN
jgi:hypothetical protein